MSDEPWLRFVCAACAEVRMIRAADVAAPSDLAHIAAWIASCPRCGARIVGRVAAQVSPC